MTSASSGARVPLLGRHRRARWLLPLFLVLLVGLSLQRLARREAPPPLVELSGASMGTTWSVKLVAPGLSVPARRALDEVIAGRLARVDALMSTWDPESELSRFNRLESTQPFPVSPETLAVFRVAREVSELSGGAFDVTVDPLVAAWGFGATQRVPAPPSPEELAALRERVGHRLVRIDEASGSLVKSHPGTRCDLSAVAKGFAVDEVARALLARGHAAFLVEVGGEVRAQGRRPDGGRWRVAIEDPSSPQRAVQRVVELEDLALATSGDYRNYYEAEGRRFSHLIDPRTARPIAHPLTSVSVVHPSAAHADALATALIVLGPEEGYALAQRSELAAYFLVRDDEGKLQPLATPRFRALGGG